MKTNANEVSIKNKINTHIMSVFRVISLIMASDYIVRVLYKLTIYCSYIKQGRQSQTVWRSSLQV